MTKDVNEIREKLVGILKKHMGDLKITQDKPGNFEVKGTVEAMQGKQKVDGIYFASVVPKPKDVRFYFFPVYTHKEEVGELDEALKKFLKGKSCFHVKHMDDEIEDQFNSMVEKSIAIYKADNLL